MPIFARWRPLSSLPERRGRDPLSGVYEIADGDRWTIYVGQSGRDVPTRIHQHLAAGGCVADRAEYWRMAESRVPQAEEADLLARHLARHGALPTCNDAKPRPRDAQRRYRERSRGG